MKEKLATLPEEVKFGVAGGMFYIFASIITYAAGIHIFQSLTLDLLLFFTVIAISILAGWFKRKRFGGQITFMEASVTVFITYLIIEIMFGMYYYSLFNHIDPGLSEKLKEHHIEQLKLHSKDAEALQEQIRFIRDTDYHVTSGVIAGRLTANMLTGLVIALLSGAFLKRSESTGLHTLE